MLRSPGTRHTPKARRIWQRLGGTSTSSSVECRGVAHLRYALRTRGGCSYNAKIPGNATYPESTAHMATPGRDEHQLVRGVPGCSAPALHPSHPGRMLLRCAVQRVHRAGAPRSQEARRFAQARLAWERLGGTSTSSSAHGRGCAVTAGG